MRVITGTARGVNLFTLDGNDLRPTSQRVKEAAFSVIQFYIPGASVLDLFSGTGQLGIEALSRGATSAVFVDANEESIKLIKRNLKKTNLTEKARVVKSEAFRFIAANKKQFDIVFIDPPYELNLARKMVRRVEPSVKEGGFVLCETEVNVSMIESVEDLKLIKQYKYGQTLIWLYRKNSKESENEDSGISG